MTPAAHLALLALQFGQVNRATRLPDGVTPESDTDHTFMLGLLACAVAANHPELDLDIGRVAAFALVHDFVEVYADDTDTMGGLSADAQTAKDERERAALERIRVELAAFPWIASTIDAYAADVAPEARWVRYLDKVCPRLTHTLNGGATHVRVGRTVAEFRALHDRQIATLAARYPEFAHVAGALLVEASREAEAALECALASGAA